MLADAEQTDLVRRSPRTISNGTKYHERALTMNIEGLKPQQQVALTNGDLAEVIDVLPDTSELRIRYL